jgi:bifunctional polynucleotide phosphatase/kinase
MCGSPGAGKSSYYWKHLQPLGYARVNQDVLKTVRAWLLRCRDARVVRRLSNILKQREKCIKAATVLLEQGTSVVVGKSLRNPARQQLHRKSKLILVDNTNADPGTRAIWVNLAKERNVPIRCVHFTASQRLCEHNDTVRALNLGSEVSCNARAQHQPCPKELLPTREERICGVIGLPGGRRKVLGTSMHPRLENCRC